MSASNGALHDLNDLRFFVAVADNGGFSAAGRALGVPKSRLSKRIAQLEERLGVRLLHRTTRRFAVTDIGERFLVHARAALDEAQSAQDVVDELRSEPRGSVRLSCPVMLAQTLLAEALPEFLAAHPKVQVRVIATNRRVDVIGEGVDIAIRVRERLDTDASLVLRSFGQSRVLLVASAAFLDAHAGLRQPQDLQALPLLSMLEHDGAQVIDLIDGDGRRASVEMEARVICGDFAVLQAAAVAGQGVAMLPELVCAPALASGELRQVLPQWNTPQGTMHFVYPHRRGQLRGVRALVEFLAERLPQVVAARQRGCSER